MPVFSGKFVDLGPFKYKSWKNKTTGEKGREIEFPTGALMWLAIIALVIAGLGWAVPAIADQPADSPSVTRPDDRGDEQGRGVGSGTDQGGPDGQGTGRGNGDDPESTTTTTRSGIGTTTSTVTIPPSVVGSTTTPPLPPSSSPTTTTVYNFRWPPIIEPPPGSPCTCGVPSS